MMESSRTALITGAASGIGLESAQELARAGHALVLLDRDARVQDVAARLATDGRQVQAMVVDLADLDALQDVGQRVLSLCGRVDVLVNNAGIHPKKEGRVYQLEDITVEDWDYVMRVNTTAPFLLCKALLPQMRKNGWGRVINIASRAGRTYSFRAGTHYSASKAAVIGLTRKLAGDFGPHGITANCIAPGQIETPLAMTSRPEVLAETVKRIPVGRLGNVTEIASAVAYLASDGASFVNGVVIDINGGETMF